MTICDGFAAGSRQHQARIGDHADIEEAAVVGVAAQLVGMELQRKLPLPHPELQQCVDALAEIEDKAVLVCS